MLRIYEINGSTYQFEEGEQPSNAKLVTEAQRVETKERVVQNKARAPRNKTVMRDER